MEEIKLNTIDEAVEQLRRGEFVIVVDDEDRENEGDFIIAAEKITEEKVNFMLREGRGVLCAPVTPPIMPSFCIAASQSVQLLNCV